MDATTAARIFGASRLAIGTALATLPARAAATWIGDDARRPATQVMTVAMGARDAALGAGVLRTAGTRASRPWIVAGAVSDAADLVATLRSAELPLLGRVSTTVIASGAIAGAVWLLAQDA